MASPSPVKFEEQRMTHGEPSANDELIEKELDQLVHASREAGTVEAPEISDRELAEVNALTDALARLREAERGLTEVSRSSLGVSPQELRALQYLVAASRQGELVTPSALADYLRISAASTTKLLNRLERGQHITRALHPHDRRAIQIDVTPQSEALTQRSVGRQQARRFFAAARLTSSERALVTEFLDQITHDMERDRETWSDTHDLSTSDELT